MPDILVKNKQGTDEEYTNVNSVTFNQVGGGTVTYNYGDPQPTEEWQQVQYLLSHTSQSTFTIIQLQLDKGTMFSISTKGTWYKSGVQLIKVSDTQFNAQQKLTNGCALSVSSGDANTYFFDQTTKILSVIQTATGTLGATRKLGNRQLIITAYKIITYDYQQSQFDLIYTFSPSSNQMSGFLCVQIQDCLLFSSSSSNNDTFGLYKIDKQTFQVTQLCNVGKHWISTLQQYTGKNNVSSYILKVPNGVLISGNTSYSSGVLYYKYGQSTATLLGNSSGYGFFPNSNINYNNYYKYNSAYSRIIENYGVYLTSSSPNKSYWFDFDTQVLTDIATGFYINQWVQDDYIVIGWSTNAGCVVFIKSTKTWYRPITTGDGYRYAVQVQNGFVFGNSSSTYFYNTLTSTLQTVSSTIGFTYGIKTVNGAFLSGATIGIYGIYFYDQSTKTLTQTSVSIGQWRGLKSKTNNNILFGSTEGNVFGNYFYDYTQNTFTLINSSDRSLGGIQQVDDGWIVCGCNFATHLYFVSYNGVGTQITYSSSIYGLGKWGNTFPYGVTYYPNRPYTYKFGDYQIYTGAISNSQGAIRKISTNQAVTIVRYDSPGSSRDSNIFSNVYMLSLSQDQILILSGGLSYSYPVYLNKNTGDCYYYYDSTTANTSFPLDNCPLYDRINYYKISANGDFLIFPNVLDTNVDTNRVSVCKGIFLFDMTTKQFKQLIPNGEYYFNSYETAQNGIYIYYSIYKFSYKAFYDFNTKQITIINGEGN